MFGGNFLHSLNIKRQMEVAYVEKQLKVIFIMIFKFGVQITEFSITKWLINLGIKFWWSDIWFMTNILNYIVDLCIGDIFLTTCFLVYCHIMWAIPRGVETLSQLLDILTYFHHSCPAPYIHVHVNVYFIQISFNLPDIH